MQSPTKVKWASMKEALLKVPARHRDIAWKEGLEIIEAVLAGRNNLTPDVDIDTMRFSVACEICGNLIMIGEDYVYKGATSKTVHYDCHHKAYEDRV